MIGLLWFAACIDPAPTSGEPVTFYRDVRPLLATSCARCHTEGGLGAGRDFLDYEVARTWADIMLDRIDAGEMPPPAADPECHPYQDAEFYAATPALRDVLARWIDQGTPEGDAASAPPATVAEPAHLPRRDLEFIAPAPANIAFQDGNDYICFYLGKMETGTYVTGLEFLPDHPEVSHHALLFSDFDGGSADRVTDPASQSWPCSVGDLPGEMIHGWAPSNGAAILPEGAGIFVPGGSEIVLQMHYYDGPSDIATDQPGYALTTAPLAEQLLFLPVGPTSFRIPAGDPSHTERAEFDLGPYTLGGAFDLEVWGVFPHMHLLGSAYDFHAEAPSGDKCLSRADQYDFSMQPTYWFDEPVRVTNDDTLVVSCTWDNSAGNPLQPSDPPVDVVFGENTEDEMCYGFFYVTLVL